MILQEAQDLPDDPPTLLVNGISIDAFAIDWRTGNARDQPPPESVDKVGFVTHAAVVELTLQRSAMPSEVTVGVYPSALKDIDPRQPPPRYVSCVAGAACDVVAHGDDVIVDLSPLFPANATASVFTVAASYFAEDQGRPFSNSVTWAFEVTR